MQILYRYFIHILILLVQFSFQPSISGEDSGEFSRGISYKMESDRDNLLTVHILEVDPSAVRIVPARALDSGLGRETVQSMARRHGALAAVNGGFFQIDGKYDGRPMGVLKISGAWYATPYKARGAIGWKDAGKTAFVDRIHAECTVEVDGDVFPIEGVNRPDVLPMMYNPSFHRNTLTNYQTEEWCVREGKIAELSKRGSMPIPSKGWVLSVDEARKGGKIGAAAGFRVSIRPQLGDRSVWDSLEHIVGGVPMLIYNGRRVTDYSPEQARERFLSGRYARTAVGILPNGNWVFVVADGNLPESSMGMTVPQLAAFMEKLGCVQALNLDGGGSSTLVVRGKVVNKPTGDEDENSSEVRQRRVSDAILVLPNK